MIGLFSLIVILFLSSTNLKDVVREFHDLKSRESEVIFVQNHARSSQPSILGYVCAVEMKQAKYGYNPISKIIIFKRTKKKLDSLVESNPTNVHLRYIRLVLQEKTPGFLGYNDFIKEDKTFLKNKLEILDASDYLDSHIYNNTSL
jgi:hypothetical protein